MANNIVLEAVITAKQYLSNKFEQKDLATIYKSYEDLPLYLNAETISKALGIAISSAYELMQEKDFPTFKVGSRKLVEKEKFRKWVDEHSGGGK